ncbi:MAG: glyoxalase [Pegethrix bostrychoides GSE-TBD4-15B]|jgi:predicted enzyme related to lactoylglutathione lyase|uniref:Glyoxalase n=1 Tax=Pegethrix bostrychoides GSE-TBD4-15B TaxID=2839662 RepID=A0A951U4C4_9CYAN|nr:glyoxalase [Pegethrix bostrychoides GSE-TBD4-15B]
MQLEQIFVALADSISGQLLPFYQGLFEQAPSIQQSGYAEFELPGLRLGIFRPQAKHQAEFTGGAGSISLCLEVASLEAAIDRLNRLGYPPPGAVITASHGREIYAYDPAGNRLILHESKSL